jgi:hypothetical protein
MNDDSEPIMITHKTGLGDIFTDALTATNYKMIFLLMFVFIIITSDVFTSRILYRFDGAVDNNVANSYGTLLQSMFLAIGYIILDVFIRYDVL